MDTGILKRLLDRLLLSAAVAATIGFASVPVRAEAPPEAAAALAEQVPEPLSAKELEILVARIALYPDELIAVVSAASLYPLQIVEAQRFLDQYQTNKTLKPKTSWDGSIVSLLNYPEIVKMMSDDLDWTQLLGESIVNQQDDVLSAIQQLREQAVANGIIKSDEKVKVVEKEETIVIEPASKEVIYVPQYAPEMLYEPDYVYQPITYFPDPYPYYWNPAATFFAATVTGVIWAAAVDWDDGFWGGDWDWNDGWGNNDVDIDFDCNNCIIGSDFSGKLNFNDVDWTKIDRDKIKFDNDTFQNFDNSKFKDSFKNNDKIQLKDKAKFEDNRLDKTSRPGKGDIQTKDIRKSTLDKMKDRPVKDFKPSDKMAKPGNIPQKPNVRKPDIKPADKMERPASINRPVGKPKPGLEFDQRPQNVSPLGDMNRSRDALKQSQRGNKAMGGGVKRPQSGGGAQKKIIPKHNVGGGGGRGHRR